MALMTYAAAVRHLKQEGVLDGSPEDADVRMKMEQASAYVLTYLQRPAEWDETSDPDADPEFAIALALAMRVLTWLYRYRGDDPDAPGLESILNLTTCGMLKDRVMA